MRVSGRSGSAGEAGAERCALPPRSASCPQLCLPPQRRPATLPEFCLSQDHAVPRLVTWTVLDRETTASLVQAHREEALRIIRLVLERRGCCGEDLRLGSLYLGDSLEWALDRHLSQEKISSWLGILFTTHGYFLSSPDRTYSDVYTFCRESLVLHSIENPPKGARVLGYEESRDCLVYFCHTYLPMLPLLRISLVPNYRLEINWSTRVDSDSPVASGVAQKRKSTRP